MYGVKRSALFGAITACVIAGAADAATTTTVGDDAVFRANSDSFDEFVIGYESNVFQNGLIIGWEVFVNYTGDTGRVGLLVLSNEGGLDYRVERMEIREVTEGRNAFDDLYIPVQDGQFLALFMSAADVAFDRGADAGANGFVTNNFQLALDNPSSGDVITMRASGVDDRAYSFNATVVLAPVPLPASLPLFVMALGGLAYLGRRRAAYRTPGYDPRRGGASLIGDRL